jgi:glycosyltransferase involved in cell wall biosynthesis
MLGLVPAEQVPQLYADSDASAVLLRDLPIFNGAVPTKMLEAMAAARPLLLAARGESARLLEQAGSGLAVTPGDASALADGFRRLQRDQALRTALGQAGRRYVEANFGAERAAQEWIGHLIDAVERHARSSGDPARRAG